jgi:hypothetical protein
MPDRQSNAGSSFGKRGHVKVSLQPGTAPGALPQGGLLSSNNSTLKWAGGAVAGLFLLGLVSGGLAGGGVGGSGILGGILGGLLGNKIANSMRSSPGTATPAATPRSAAQSTTVQRGGFGSTGASGVSSAS